jgi:hypothetical protein
MFYLYAARAARGLGNGFAAIILPTYLSEFGFSPFQIGIVATAALRVVARQSCSTLQSPIVAFPHASFPSTAGTIARFGG